MSQMPCLGNKGVLTEKKGTFGGFIALFKKEPFQGRLMKGCVILVSNFLNFAWIET